MDNTKGRQENLPPFCIVYSGLFSDTSFNIKATDTTVEERKATTNNG